MSINTEIKTGNPIVDEIGMLNLSGNVIPETWYQTIVSDKGKVNCLAILVLSDIVYWYRPQECRNETDLSVRYVKRFHDDEYLQRSYEQICSKFNISKKQARDSIVFLENLGVIKRHFKDVQYANGAFVNLMFIELIPSVLKELTFPEEKGVYKNVDTPLQKDRDPSTKKETPPYKNVGAYTKNTTEITTENNSYPSISLNTPEKEASFQGEKDIEVSDDNDPVALKRKWTAIIKRHISYDELIKRRPGDVVRIDEFVRIMVQVVCFGNDVYNIKGCRIPAKLVAGQFLMLNMHHIIHVLESFESTNVEMTAPDNYIIASLYSSYNTYENEVAQSLNCLLHENGLKD